MTRRETIIELARTLRDVQPSVNSSTPKDAGGRPGADSGFLSEVDLYRMGSYQHLERALNRMKLEGDPVRQWRWHFTNRYIASERKPYKARTSGSKVMISVDQCWQPASPSRGHREALGGLYSDSTGGRLVMIEQWHNHVQVSQVDKALDWLDRHLPSRLWLPDWSKAA